MLPLIESHRAEIAELCRRFLVRRLDVFGSAARVTDFDPARSDVDVLVSYDPAAPSDLGEYFDLRDALAALLGRDVDLVMADAALHRQELRDAWNLAEQHAPLKPIAPLE